MADYELPRFIEVYYNSQWTAVDVFSDYSIRVAQEYFGKNATDLRAPISESLELPWTEKNGILFQVNKTSPTKVPDLDCRITDATTVFFQGRMRVDGFRWNGLADTIKVQLEDQLAYAIREMKKLNMSEFITDTENENNTDNGGYRHMLYAGDSGDAGTINQLNQDFDNMKYVFQDTLGRGAVKSMYSMRPDFDFGSGNGTQGLQPVFNVKNIIQSAFGRVGLTVDSDFFDDNTYLDGTAAAQYPASSLFMSLPFYARTRGAWTPPSSSPLGNLETYAERRTFDIEYLQPTWFGCPFGTGILDPSFVFGSSTTSFLWDCLVLPDYPATNWQTSNDYSHNWVEGYVADVDNTRNFAVISRPARYRFSFPSSTMPSTEVIAMKRQGSSTPIRQDLDNQAGAPDPRFYWELIIKKVDGESKKFRVSPIVTATPTTVNGANAWAVPSTTINPTAIPVEDRFIDFNTGEGFEMYLVLKAAGDNRMTIVNTGPGGNADINGDKMNDNAMTEFYLLFKKTSQASPADGFMDLSLEPIDDYFPCYYQEEVDVKNSLALQYPDMTLWELVQMIMERFNLQGAYNISTGNVEVDPIYRNRWKEQVDTASETQFIWAFDNSRPVEADVRVDSIKTVTATNASLASISDSIDGEDFPVASTNKQLFDEDADEDITLDLKSGVFTGIVHGESKDFYDPYNTVSDIEVSGVGFAEELDVSQYGFRFGFLGDAVDFASRFPRPLLEEGQVADWAGRESYLPDSDHISGFYCDYRKVYYDGPDVDYVVSCGMEDGSGSGSDESAYSLFHKDLYSIRSANANLSASFILNIETLQQIPFGTVIDFGYGPFGILSVSGVEVIEGETRAKISGYLL